MNSILQAIALRKKLKALNSTESYRLFHGPTEAQTPDLQGLAIDRYGPHAWITIWENSNKIPFDSISEILKNESIESAMLLDRTHRASLSLPTQLFGATPTEFTVRENENQFLIRMPKHRHPGLFLDLIKLRNWLSQEKRGTSALNLFSFTGSLSVAALRGGADCVTTVDLSRTTLDWAKDNFALNEFTKERTPTYAEDAFVFLERSLKRKKTFDLVISDPPSFSRGKKGTFSTKKDLIRLHNALEAVTANNGYLISIINSENVGREDFLKSLPRRGFKLIQEVQLPTTFPDHYLKGAILKRAA